MPEKVAVVGPRKGADLEAVDGFVQSLYARQPDTILVSGGADGVDTRAEKGWLVLGGTVWSYRIRKKRYDCFAIEKWEIGRGGSRLFELISEPTWMDSVSALFYRSMLVAEIADRVVAFHGKERMTGTEFTTFVSKQAEQKPTHIFSNGEWS